jgi:hypothetical protein
VLTPIVENVAMDRVNEADARPMMVCGMGIEYEVSSMGNGGQIVMTYYA